MSEFTADDEAMLKAAYEDNRGFTWTIAADALQTYLAKQAEQLTAGLNAGTETLDEFIDKLKPNPRAVPRDTTGIERY